MIPLFCKQNDLTLSLPAQTINKTDLNKPTSVLFLVENMPELNFAQSPVTRAKVLFNRVALEAAC